MYRFAKSLTGSLFFVKSLTGSLYLLVEAHVLGAVHLRDALVVPADLRVHHHPAEEEQVITLLQRESSPCAARDTHDFIMNE